MPQICCKEEKTLLSMFLFISSQRKNNLYLFDFSVRACGVTKLIHVDIFMWLPGSAAPRRCSLFWHHTGCSSEALQMSLCRYFYFKQTLCCCADWWSLMNSFSLVRMSDLFMSFKLVFLTCFLLFRSWVTRPNQQNPIRSRAQSVQSVSWPVGWAQRRKSDHHHPPWSHCLDSLWIMVNGHERGHPHREPI